MAEAPEHIERRNQVISAFVSLGIHSVIVLLLLYLTLSTPNPPYPEGGGGQGSGIEINLGFSETGLGETQQTDVTPPVENQVAPQPAQQISEKVATQDVEEVDAIKETPVKKETRKKTTITPVTEVKKTPEKPKEVVKPVEKKRQVNEALTYHRSSQGITQGSGDQGSPTGNPTSPTYKGQGAGGNGDGGSGGGSGGGNGPGIGKGKGPGVSYDLTGRTFLSLPKPVDNSQVEGDVVVEIVVDKEGKVTSATPGVRGSTTTNVELLQAAKQAALNARFDRKPDAAAYQKGTITYKFRLQ